MSDLAALTPVRKRTAARSLLVPFGGRTTYVVGLGLTLSGKDLTDD